MIISASMATYAEQGHNKNRSPQENGKPSLTFSERAYLTSRVVQSALVVPKIAIETFDGVLRFKKSPQYKGKDDEGTELPRGNEEHILLIPGFCTPELSLEPFKAAINNLQYDAHVARSKLHVNHVFHMDRHIGDRVRRAADETGDAVTIFGHSWGGRQAVMAALEMPEEIKHVIAVGSPIHDINEKPETVHVTNIYSATDAVVPAHYAENSLFDQIELEGISHLGLIFNRMVFEHTAYQLEEHTKSTSFKQDSSRGQKNIPPVAV